MKVEVLGKIQDITSGYSKSSSGNEYYSFQLRALGQDSLLQINDEHIVFYKIFFMKKELYKGEEISNKLEIGDIVKIRGNIRINSYIKDGVKKHSAVIFANEIEYILMKSYIQSMGINLFQKEEELSGQRIGEFENLDDVDNSTILHELIDDQTDIFQFGDETQGSKGLPFT